MNDNELIKRLELFRDELDHASRVFNRQIKHIDDLLWSLAEDLRDEQEMMLSELAENEEQAKKAMDKQDRAEAKAWR